MKSLNLSIPAIVVCQIFSLLLSGCDFPPPLPPQTYHIFACNYYSDINVNGYHEFIGRKNTFNLSEKITFVFYNYEVQKEQTTYFKLLQTSKTNHLYLN
jgi:hypothetical protein